MNELCGCCEGIERLTPKAIANRPGLNALVYRAGTHASFLETMLARLSASDFPELSGLTIRSADDPSIALLDAWATVADVLTFYQERIANEGYLHTATERRSILELARLVGYRLRPGVAASVYLAYTLEKDHDVIILPSNRAQSVPGPGELPQSFETAEKLEARFAWNVLKPRLTRPQHITREDGTILVATREREIYLKGTATGLKQGDALLFVFGTDDGQQVFSRVVTVETQAADSRTRVAIDPTPGPQPSQSSAVLASSLTASRGNGKQQGVFGSLVKQLSVVPSVPPRNSQRLERSVVDVFRERSDIQQQLLVNFSPILQGALYNAIADSRFTRALGLQRVQALPVKAAPFGHNAPLKPVFDPNKPGIVTGNEEWPLSVAGFARIDLELSLAPIITIMAAPGVASDPLTYGGRDIDSVAVTITQGTKALPRVDQQLTSDQRAGTTSIPGIDLGNGIKLTITVIPAAGGNPNEMRLVFTGGGIQQTIHLTDQTNGTQIGIQIDQDPRQLLSSGKKQGYSAGQHRVEIEFGQMSFTIASEILALVSSSTLDPTVLSLDAVYDKIVPQSSVVIERPDPDHAGGSQQIISKVKKVEMVSIADYGITGRVTQLTLERPWLSDKDLLLSVPRKTTVYAQSENRDPAEEPVDEDVGSDTIELDRLYDGLKSGRWAIVSGERTDVLQPDGITPIGGIRASELVMLASVTQDLQKLPPDNTQPLPGDNTHTFIHLAKKLKYTYRRDSVTIYGNVVPATHGETRTETLGSGDGSKSLQRFTLRQSPLTYLSAPTAAGAQSTLKVRINDILWHEADSLAVLGPTDRNYTTETDDADKTAVIFGNGQYGARLPTGVENVKAVYRTGIGKPGNVKAEQITLLATKPLGVKSVINPLRASGGADRDSRDQARRNVPVALLALDRLVSVQDYADFARTYAGIGKASAVRLSDGRRQLVHLSIVGADNIPIDESSDLFQNLFQSLRLFGDPNEPLTMAPGEVMFIVISAKVRLLPDYALEFVEPKIRTALLDFFSFERRELGQPVFQSEVFSVIQSVPGVDFVELEIMDAVDQERVIKALDVPPGSPQPPGISSLGLGNPSFVDVKLAHVNPNATDPKKRILPAQLAFLTPDLPDTLILTELPK